MQQLRKSSLKYWLKHMSHTGTCRDNLKLKRTLPLAVALTLCKYSQKYHTPVLHGKAGGRSKFSPNFHDEDLQADGDNDDAYEYCIGEQPRENVQLVAN